ncbi:hypothetical protein D3C72_479140 [compost metagenome]
MILKDDFAGGVGQIDANLEGAAITLAHFAFVHVAGHMRQTCHQAGTLSLNRTLERIRVADQEIAWRTGGNGLLHQIAQALARFFFVDQQLVEQFQEKACVEQVKRSEGAEQWLAPVAAGEASIIEAEGLAGQQFLAELAPLNLVVRL